MEPGHSPTRKMKRDDDSAGAIAEKLLEGWTLLAEYCPMEGCLAPLMRSRDGRRYCVTHSMFVMSPEEADAMQKSGDGVGPNPAQSKPAPAPPADRIDFYKQLKTGATTTTALAPVPRAAAAAAPMDVAFDTRSRSEVVDVKEVALVTVCTLAGKMEEARAALAGNQDMKECLELIKFINEIVACIKTCDSI